MHVTPVSPDVYPDPVDQARLEWRTALDDLHVNAGKLAEEIDRLRRAYVFAPPTWEAWALDIANRAVLMANNTYARVHAAADRIEATRQSAAQ